LKTEALKEVEGGKQRRHGALIVAWEELEGLRGSGGGRRRKQRKASSGKSSYSTRNIESARNRRQRNPCCIWEKNTSKT